MKFLKPLLIVSILIGGGLNSLSAQSPQIKIVKTKAYLDGYHFLTIESEGNVYHVFVPGMTKPVIRCVAEPFNDPDKVSPTDPKGQVHYLTWNFRGLNVHAQTRCKGFIRRHIAEQVIGYDLLNGGALNVVGVLEFCQYL